MGVAMRFLMTALAFLLTCWPAFAAELKITILYGQPQSAEAFDKYYYAKHMPMIYAVKEVKKVEISRPRARPNGDPPPYYLVTEIWFDSPEVFSTVAATPEWKAIGSDVANFAPPDKATIVVSVVEPKR
jgi:uncharacterized protein (TIGR02118 family)